MDLVPDVNHCARLVASTVHPFLCPTGVKQIGSEASDLASPNGNRNVVLGCGWGCSSWWIRRRGASAPWLEESRSGYEGGEGRKAGARGSAGGGCSGDLASVPRHSFIRPMLSPMGVASPLAIFRPLGDQAHDVMIITLTLPR